MKKVQTTQLSIAFFDDGPHSGWPCILCHGFPYSPDAFTECVPMLLSAGARVIRPFLRGYGSTQFLSAETPRSGEQAVLGNDLLEFMDALQLPSAVLAGYDWGGRACCIVSALWPQRVDALVSANSYNIQNIAKSMQPAPAVEEASYWYQYYFHSERGRQSLLQDRRDVTRLLWKMWSPTWHFDEATFARSAEAFDNPDFVEVVIHSYRHRYALVEGDPVVADIEAHLALQPDISVNAITVDGAVDGVSTSTAHHAAKFTAQHEHRVFDDAGHNLPQEKPQQWVAAILDARG